MICKSLKGELLLVTYKVSRTINAPLKYVYDWATDYTEEDNALWGGKHPRIILLKTRRKVVYASYNDGANGKPILAVRMVSLSPSNHSWHLDYYSEEDIESGEYKLKSLGKSKTQLSIVLKNTWKYGKSPTRQEFEDHAKVVWDGYVPALEKDYSSGKPAK
jgi:hypothetical protein